MLRDANTELGVTVLLVTHDPDVSGQVRRVVAIRDGRTSTETLNHVTADEHGHEARSLSSTPCSIGPGGFSCPGAH